MFPDEGGKLLVCPTARIDVELVLSGIIFDQFVSAMTGFAGTAVHQRIREAADMTGRNPYLRIHQNRGIKTDIVFAFLNKFLLPGALDIILVLYAEWAVIL